jgi:hypothetical protein
MLVSRHSGSTIQKNSPPLSIAARDGRLQRKCACGSHTIGGGNCNECNKGRTLQRSPAGAGEKTGAQPEVPAIVHDVLRSPGQPLDGGTRAFMEPRFGHDFSKVRVHADAPAAESAEAINAQAYTVGRDVVVGDGKYQPWTTEGRKLLGHELAHVVQQQAYASGGTSELRTTHPSENSEHEARAAANAIVTGNAFELHTQQPSAIGLVQRQEEEDFITRPGSGSTQPTRPGLPVPDVNIDPTALSEPHCPRTPTRLGNLAPTPPCNEDGEDIDGNVFQFCSDSDVLSDPADLGQLRTLVSGQPSGTSFRLRAYASIEGPGTAQNATLYNRNLSCHRLNRMIREMVNLGVQEQQIEAVSKGPTERFGVGAAARPLNRVAVIEADPPQQAPRVDATGMTMSQIRNLAKQRLENGDYPLAADAYFARWSCGRWRTLGEAVARTSVLIEGAETSLSASVELGTTASTGANTIVISRRIADATDPIGCAANRITDLTFHHFSRPVLSNFEDQHRAGMHLVHLAGFPECRISLDPLNTSFDVRSRPNPVDPFSGFIPRCADQPLPGPLAGQRGPATMETPPNFTVTSLGLSSGTSGAAVPSPSSNPLTVGIEPDSPFVVDATVDAAGAPASIANFEIGFVQTVMAENWINTHVDGRRERRRFPLPLRDGARRNDPLSEPPWFNTNSKVAAAPGANPVSLTDAPNFRAFRFLPDIPSSLFVQSIQVPRPGGGRDVTLERPTFQPLLGPLLPANTPSADIQAEQRRQAPLRNNVPDRGSRVLDFNTWVVARRRNPPAPDTHGATQFLGGLRLTFRLNANWSSTASGSITGSGSFNVSSRPATGSDAGAVMLRGATPIDFVGPGGVPLFAEFLDIEGAVPRVQAGGLPRTAYFDAVRQIALSHRTGPIMRGEVILRISVEVATGRVILDTRDLQRGAIRVLNTGFAEIDTPETQAFARAIFPEVRKLVVAPGVSPNEPQTGTMPVALRLQPLGASGAP